MTQKELNEKATKETIASLLQDLRDSFATRSDEFFAVLGKKIQEREYNGRQLKRGIHDVIETCGYNQLSISDVLKSCDTQSPFRTVVYSVLMPNKSWQMVTRSEKAYLDDCSMYTNENEKPKLIKYID